MDKIIKKLLDDPDSVTSDEFRYLLTDANLEELMQISDTVRKKHYQNHIYIRGLIEVTNYCTNDCYYCGIRRSASVNRYRLTKEDILNAAKAGYNIGFRTFVLQGGEDPVFDDVFLVDVITNLKQLYPDCAITLSLGERSKDSYQKLFDAGADRYLLRHETSDSIHYSKLHPEEQTLENRLKCLNELKNIGFQTGCGVMVGSPYQTLDNLVLDIEMIRAFKPHMVGIGPFIPHHDTPFKDFDKGSLALTLRMYAITRIMIPKVLLPATTALSTLDPKGRELGIRAGANVVMPNLSPFEYRKDYTLYDGKVFMNEEAAETLEKLVNFVDSIGYKVVQTRGDALDAKI